MLASDDGDTFAEESSFCVSTFAFKCILSQIIPPFTIVEGVVFDHNLQFRVMFGEHVQTFEGSNDTMEPHTVAAFGLGPTGNLQGGLRFFI